MGRDGYLVILDYLTNPSEETRDSLRLLIEKEDERKGT